MRWIWDLQKGVYSNGMFCLMAQGRDAEAQDVKAQFDEAWQYADIELTSSRILGPEKEILGEVTN